MPSFFARFVVNCTTGRGVFQTRDDPRHPWSTVPTFIDRGGELVETDCGINFEQHLPEEAAQNLPLDKMGQAVHPVAPLTESPGQRPSHFDGYLVDGHHDNGTPFYNRFMHASFCGTIAGCTVTSWRAIKVVGPDHRMPRPA